MTRDAARAVEARAGEGAAAAAVANSLRRTLDSARARRKHSAFVRDAKRMTGKTKHKKTIPLF